MRYVRVTDWGTDNCPGDRDKMYESLRFRHILPGQPPDGYPPGDRLHYMQCKHCDAVIWGFCIIEEEDYLSDLI